MDDISFEYCALPPANRTCESSEFSCTRGSCINPNRICDLVDDCGDNSDENLVKFLSYSKKITFTLNVQSILLKIFKFKMHI
jgi:hypothetical protein